MKTKQTLVCGLLAVLCATLFAQNAASDFEIDANGTITKYVGWGTTVVIPETINGVRVTAIGDKAFASSDLASVTIPRGVRSIGGGAFNNNKLTKVAIPDSVTYIGYEAFSRNQLISVAIPGNGVTIGNWAFANNPITSITLGRNHVFTDIVPAIKVDNKNVQSNLFYDYVCNDRKGGTYAANRAVGATKKEGDFQYIETQYGAYVTGYTGSSGNRLIIPSKIANLSVKAISGFRGIGRVQIPDSVTYIANGAFNGDFHANNLSSVTIGNGVTYIGVAAFRSNELTSVTIPDSVTYIGGGINYSIFDGAFSSNKLTSITIGNSVTIESGFPYGAFPSAFEDIYNTNGRTAGTYILNNYEWTTREMAEQQEQEQLARQRQQEQEQLARQRQWEQEREQEQLKRKELEAKEQQLSNEMKTIYSSISGKNKLSNSEYSKVVRYYELFLQYLEIGGELGRAGNDWAYLSDYLNRLEIKFSNSQKQDFFKRFQQ
jgi:hypothetical protein